MEVDNNKLRTLKALFPSFMSFFCLSVLFSTESIFAMDLPPGNAILTFQYRQTELNPQTGSTISRPESNYRLSFLQETLNWGNCSGFINWVDEPSNHRLGTWLIEARDLYFNDVKLDSGLGDNIIRLSIIGDQPLRFANLADPDTMVEGARFHLTSERGELDLFAGDIVAPSGSFGTGVEYLDETMVGIRSRYMLLPGLRLGAQILRTGRSEDQEDPTIFRRNDIYGFSAEVEPWPGYRLLQGELNFSHYQRLDEGKGEKKGWDYSLILGPVIRIPKLSLDANFRHIGTNYHPFSRFYASDQQGFFLSTEYRPWEFLSLFASGERYRNNLAGDPDVATIETRNGILGFRVGADPFPLVSLRYGITDNKSQRDQPAETENQLQSYTGEITYSYANWYPIFRYQRFDYQDRVSPASESLADIYFLELRRSFSGGSYGWVNGEWDKVHKKAPITTTDTYTARLGADCRPFSALGIRGEVSYSRTRDELKITDAERKGLLLALTAYLPWKFSIYLEYQYARVDYRIGTYDSDEHRLYLQASQRFDWGKPVAAMKSVAPGAPTPGFGAIFGYAFNDLNGNGARDAGEIPLAGIRLLLEDGSIATSDGSGKFSFTNVVMGAHTLALDTKRIPIEYDFVGEAKSKLEVKRRGTLQLDLPFQPLGRMGGQVIEDANGNGRGDEGEKGIPNALITAVLGEKEFFTYTDEKGQFLFEGLRGGSYRLALDLTSLPQGAEMTSEEQIAATLPIGEEISRLTFLAQIKPRPVIKKIFGTPEEKPESPQPPSPGGEPTPKKKGDQPTQ